MNDDPTSPLNWVDVTDDDPDGAQSGATREPKLAITKSPAEKADVGAFLNTMVDENAVGKSQQAVFGLSVASYNELSTRNAQLNVKLSDCIFDKPNYSLAMYEP